MRRHKGVLVLLIAIFAIVGVTTLATLRGQEQHDSARRRHQQFDMAEFESQFPVTDYTTSDPEAINRRASRQRRGRKYNGVSLRLDESINAPITLQTNWETGLSALPVARSHAVVMGEVIGAEAYLAEDGTSVYSEIAIRLGEVLKNTSRVQLNPGSRITVEREGGRVRFPSGQVRLSYTAGHGMPRVGRRYVFFLTHDFPFPIQDDGEQDLYLLTGYELRAGRVFPLDNPGDGTHPLATTYRGANDETLLSDLRSVITNTQ